MNKLLSYIQIREIREQYEDLEKRDAHGCDGCGCSCCYSVPRLLAALEDLRRDYMFGPLSSVGYDEPPDTESK